MLTNQLLPIANWIIKLMRCNYISYGISHLAITALMSIVTTEGSYATLRRLKTWLCSRIQEVHLISQFVTIDRFGKRDNEKKRLDFVTQNIINFIEITLSELRIKCTLLFVL